MKKEKKKNKSIIGSLIFIAIGFVCGIFIGKYMVDPEKPLQSLILLLVLFYASMILQIIIHEGGHLIFGLLSGYKFVSFRIGSLALVKIKGKLRFKKLSLAGTGGQCLLDPPEMQDGKVPYALYNLGGSILNLISAALFFALGLAFPSVGIFASFCNLTAIVGVGLALMNGIPRRVATVDNDGYNTLSISKDPLALRSLWIQMRINALSTEGVRLKDMPEDWFILPEGADMKNSMTAVIPVFRCNRLMDELSFEEAEAETEKLLSGQISVAGLYQFLLKCDLAFCEMIKDMPNAEKIESILNKEQQTFMKSMKNFPSVIRTEYAYTLLIKKDIEAAKKIKERFIKISKSYPSSADIESENELFQIAETKAIMPLTEI